MPAPFSDFLMQPVAGVMTAWTGVYVRLVSNNTSTAYVSTAATDSKGKFTFTTIPGDNYTVYTGPTNTGAWTGTGDTSYIVPYAAGDDIVGHSFTGSSSSPYTNTLPGTPGTGIAAQPTPAGVTAGKIWDFGGQLLHVSAYGAKGDGVADDTQAIQNALTATPPGGTTFMGPGTFLVHPLTAGFGTTIALDVKAGTRFAGSGAYGTTIKFAASQASGTYAIAPSTVNAIGILFVDFALDMNAANQTQGAALFNEGFHIDTATKVDFQHVRVLNCLGGASAEGASYNIRNSSHVNFEECEVTNTATNSGSGFSASWSTFITYKSCRCTGVATWAGFTNFHCTQMEHFGCHVYLGAATQTKAINTEYGIDIKYYGCVAGGIAAADSGSGGPYPFTANQNLGNGGNGFWCLGGTNVEYVHCVSRGNGTGGNAQGIGFAAGTGATLNCKIIGGNYSSNSQYGVFFGAAADQQNVRISGSPRFNANTSAASNIGGGSALFGGVALAVPANTVVTTYPWPVDGTVYVVGNAAGGVTVKINGTQLFTLAASGIASFRLAAGVATTFEYDYTNAPVHALMLDG